VVALQDHSARSNSYSRHHLFSLFYYFSAFQNRFRKTNNQSIHFDRF
jgi:hypothetical protein